jgi:hypothetical protein
MFASKDLFFSKPSGYQISRSVRMRASASAYFNRTPAVSGSSTTWTWSGWVKRGALGGASAGIFYAGVLSTSNDETGFQFRGDDTLQIFQNNGASTVLNKITSSVYRDPSAWYHFVLTFDTTNATAEDRVRLYVNGVRVTSFSSNTNISQNATTYVNSTSYGNRIFRDYTTGYLDGYLTEVNFVDGQALTPSSFGETNTITGVWQPKKYTGTYGTNGFYLNFSDNSNNTAATIGKDYSGNGNNWTPNNISVTAGATYDSMLDVPTPFADGGNGRGNYCVWNSLVSSGATYSNGNLQFASNATQSWISPTIGIDSGKFYWEETVSVISGVFLHIGATQLNGATTESALIARTYYADGNKYSFNTGSITGAALGSSYTTNDIIGIAVDMSAGKIWFSKNGVWQGSGDPSAGTNEAYSGLTGLWGPFAGKEAVGNNPTVILNCGQRPFAYTPPTGFKALNTQNLPTPAISNGANYFAATTYTGTGSALTIANTVGIASFQPDFVWVKGRSGATDHALYDSVRGTTKDLVSNSTAAETTQATGLTAFGSTGFTVGALAKMNTNAATYIGWQWLAGAGTSSSNTSGSITSTVSVGATQGFSVVTYTGINAAATVGHGLGVAPKMIIVKTRNSADIWCVYTSTTGAGNYLALNSTIASTANTAVWNNTSPTSSVFSIANSAATGTAQAYVAYCFSEVAGYSKFGSYTGNGSTDGPFVFCGFRPRFVMIKRTDAIADWQIMDTSRSSANVEQLALYANTSGAEASYTGTDGIDGLSNGFKIRVASSANVNANTATYIFAAFAESPFKLALAR